MNERFHESTIVITRISFARGCLSKRAIDCGCASCVFESCLEVRRSLKLEQSWTVRLTFKTGNVLSCPQCFLSSPQFPLWRSQSHQTTSLGILLKNLRVRKKITQNYVPSIWVRLVNLDFLTWKKCQHIWLQGKRQLDISGTFLCLSKNRIN